MDINIMAIILILVFSGLAWWVNEKLNSIPMLKTVIQVLIVVVAIVLLLQSLGVINGGHITIR